MHGQHSYSLVTATTVRLLPMKHCTPSPMGLTSKQRHHKTTPQQIMQATCKNPKLQLVRFNWFSCKAIQHDVQKQTSRPLSILQSRRGICKQALLHTMWQQASLTASRPRHAVWPPLWCRSSVHKRQHRNKPLLVTAPPNTLRPTTTDVSCDEGAHIHAHQDYCRHAAT